MAKTVIENDLEVKGNLVPDSADTRTLGTAEKPWQELFLTGSSLYIGGYPLQLNTDRLVFNANKTLAYTEEVTALEGQVTTLEQTSNMSIQEVNQTAHGFSVLDSVYYDSHSEDGAFTNDGVWGLTGITTGAVREDVVGKEPYYTYNSTDNTYFLSCSGGRFNSSMYYLSKNGASGNGDLQAIVDCNIVGFYYYGAAGLLLESSTGARVFLGYGGSYGSSADSMRWETVGSIYKSGALAGNVPFSNYTLFDTTRLKVQIEGDTVRLFYQRIGIDGVFIELSSGNTRLQFPEGTWNNYSVGFGLTGGAYSTGTYYDATCTFRDLEGTLTVAGGDVSTWEYAGGPADGEYAEGVVCEVIDENNFKVATAGILTVTDAFIKGIPTYLSLANLGGHSYNKPVGKVQKLWKGLSGDTAQLILEKPPAGTVSWTDANNVTALLPETPDASTLGSSTSAWDALYANDIILGGNSLTTFNTIRVAAESDVVAGTVADVLTFVAGSNIVLSTNAVNKTVTITSLGTGGTTPGTTGNIYAFNIEGTSGVIQGDQIVPLTTIDYLYDPEGLYSSNQYTCAETGTYILEYNINCTVNAGAITAAGIRKNNTYLDSVSESGSFSGRKVLLLQENDTLDLYYDDSTNGTGTIIGSWSVYKIDKIADLTTYAQKTGSETATQVAYWSDTETLTGNDRFTFDGTTLTVGAPGSIEDGYGYGDSIGSFVLYGELYVDDAAIFVESVSIGGQLSLSSFLYLINISEPTNTAPDGGFVYTEDGALKFKGGSGTVTTIAPA